MNQRIDVMSMETLNAAEVREQTVNQTGADVAVQLMLMMLVACVSNLADDPDAFRSQIRDRLLDISKAVSLPIDCKEVEPEVRTAARAVIENVFAGASAIQFPRVP